jgi:hypothetical protein
MGMDGSGFSEPKQNSFPLSWLLCFARRFHELPRQGLQGLGELPPFSPEMLVFISEILHLLLKPLAFAFHGLSPGRDLSVFPE